MLDGPSSNYLIAGNYVSTSSNDSQYMYFVDRTGHSLPISTQYPTNVTSMPFTIRVPNDGYSYESNTGTIKASRTPNISLGTNTVTLALASYFVDPSGLPLTYTMIQNPLSNAVLAGSNLSITGNWRERAMPIIVRATNTDNQYADNTIFYVEKTSPNPALVGTLSTQYIGSRSVAFNLSNYFTDTVTNSGLTFSIPYNPQGSATINGNNLSIVGNSRGLSYNVVVRATNGYAKFSERTVTISENKEFQIIDRNTSNAWKYNYSTQRVSLQNGSNMSLETVGPSGTTLGTGTNTAISYWLRDNITGNYIIPTGTSNELTLASGTGYHIALFTTDAGSNWTINWNQELQDSISSLPYQGQSIAWNSNNDTLIPNSWADQTYTNTWVVQNIVNPLLNDAISGGARNTRSNLEINSNTIIRMPLGPFSAALSMNVSHPILGPGGSNSYAISCSHSSPLHAFDSKNTLYSVENGSPWTAWFRLESPIMTTLQSYSVYGNTGSATFAARVISSWSVQGSVDGSNWDTIDTQSGQTWSTTIARRSYNIPTMSNSIPFNSYRLLAQSKSINSTRHIIIVGDIEFFVKPMI
jgi:hypothetical protein